MITATLTDIGIACRTLMAATIAGRAVILSESDDSDTNAREIFVINAVQPGDVDAGELGGRAGIAVQNGVFLLNLSYIRNDSAIKADAEEWTVVRDTHEAIISREQFAAVQAILDQTASRAKAREVKAYTPNLLKGKVFCAHCGGSLHRQRNIRKKSDDVYFYHCLSQSRISKGACPGVTIREDMLLDMLADMLQDALDTALGQYTLSLAELPRQAAERAELREKITSRKQEIQRLRGIVRSLYENRVQGVLTKDEYFDYKEKYESRIADLSVEMEQLEDGLRTMDAQAEQHQALEQDAAQIKTDRALTGALIERLIDRIEVSHDKQITVRYRFQSEFETYAEVLEQCRNM